MGGDTRRRRRIGSRAAAVARAYGPISQRASSRLPHAPAHHANAIAALRQARYFWPRVYGGELPVLTESKLPLLGNAARRNRLQTDQATLRDLASEIEWAKVSNVHPDDYARLAPARAWLAYERVDSPLDATEGPHKLLVPNSVRLAAAKAYIEYVADLLPGSSAQIMYAVGVIEIVAGLVVAAALAVGCWLSPR